MGAIDPPAWDSTALILPLILVVDRKAQKLPLHRIDLGEVGRDEMITAALAPHHLEATAHEGPGGSSAAEMDERGEILLLLRAGRHVRCVNETRRDAAVHVHRRELDGLAWHHTVDSNRARMTQIQPETTPRLLEGIAQFP